MGPVHRLRPGLDCRLLPSHGHRHLNTDTFNFFIEGGDANFQPLGFLLSTTVIGGPGMSCQPSITLFVGFGRRTGACLVTHDACASLGAESASVGSSACDRIYSRMLA